MSHMAIPEVLNPTGRSPDISDAHLASCAVLSNWAAYNAWGREATRQPAKQGSELASFVVALDTAVAALATGGGESAFKNTAVKESPFYNTESLYV
jgi:hypothetical protein